MEEHLLNIREAAEYLNISERQLKESVDKGEMPAYKIGGAFLRFKQSQLVILKSSLQARAKKDAPKRVPEHASTGLEGVKDFLYFNDFYILSAIIILIAVVLMIAT